VLVHDSSFLETAGHELPLLPEKRPRNGACRVPRDARKSKSNDLELLVSLSRTLEDYGIDSESGANGSWVTFGVGSWARNRGNPCQWPCLRWAGARHRRGFGDS